MYLYIKLNNKRHFSIETDDHSRVILETEHGSGKSDYINANYIDVSMICVKILLLKCFFLVKVRIKYQMKHTNVIGCISHTAKKKKNSVHDNDIHVYTFIHLLYATSNVCV